MNQRYINIIRHYTAWKVAHPDTHIIHSANQHTLTDVIREAAMCRNHLDKRHIHQRRLKKINLEAFTQSIMDRREEIETVNNFESLISVIRQQRVHGIGDLTIYDVAVRIGAYKNIWPEVIYLHAGAKIGAVALINDINGETVNRDELPEEFRNSPLSCFELEDILCIYKRMFLRNRAMG